MRRLRLGALEIEGVVGLAPMAGYTEPVFRGLCREHGAAFVVTELVSCEGLVRGSGRTSRYLEYEANERPIGMQLFGSDPGSMGRAAAMLTGLAPDFIDINMGCPVPKVVTREAGAALLRNKVLLGDLARAVVEGAHGTPVTAKIRSGWDRASSDLERIGEVLERAGVAAIAIHARTREERFAGRADWNDIARLKRAVSVPVIGNGDVRTGADACRMLEETGCDGVLIGRAAVGNPWIFRDARSLLEGGRAAPRPSRHEVIALAIEHLRRSVARKGLPRGLHEMRKTLACYVRGFPQAARLRPMLFQEDDWERVVELLEEYRRALGEAALEPVVLHAEVGA
jgi:tRNA-dihydrouridine synthase B